MTLRAGAAQVCITPPIGVELAGYGPFLRRRSRAVHDDLYAAALVLEQDDTRVAIVTSDIISYDVATVEHIRQLAAEETGIPAGHILVSCIHSHTSPTARVMRGWGERDAQYIALLARQVAGAIVAADNARQPARIGFGRGEHRELAWNRVRRSSGEDEGEAPVDTSVQVLRIDAEAGGEPLAILANYGCHPVMLGPKDTISADYPGAVRCHVAAAVPGCTFLFANGTCGDIDPASNRVVWGQATFGEVDRAGALLARDVVQTARGIETYGESLLAVERAWVDLPYRVLTSSQVEEELAQREAGMLPPAAGLDGARIISVRRFWHEWAQDTCDALTRGTAPTRARAELQALRIGDAVLVAMPGEIFTEIGLSIKSQSAYDHTFLITYANGNVGYIPTEQDFTEGAYASSMAFAIYGYFPFQTDVGNRLVAAAGALVGKRL
jgi:neutral ceramidase